MGERDLRSIRCAHTLLDQALRSARLGRLDLAIPPDDAAWQQAAAEGGKHHAGTTRMSDDPACGVVDRDLKVHGVHNLHVVGSSVFPTAGYANPTLTIVALAIRLADHLRAMGWPGDPGRLQPCAGGAARAVRPSLRRARSRKERRTARMSLVTLSPWRR